jgi:hypothetical protein
LLIFDCRDSNLTAFDRINPFSVEHPFMRRDGILLGGTLALLFSANGVLVLFFGLIGVAGNSLVTGGFLVASELIILLLSFRRSLVLSPVDYLFGAFLVCIAMSSALNGRSAGARDWALLAVSLFAYPACRLFPLAKFRTGFVWVSAAIVMVGAIVTAMALISQWDDVRNKPFVLGHDGAAVYFLGTLGFLVCALSTAKLTLRRSLVISVLLFLPAAIFAAAMVRFTFIAIMGGLCLAGIFSPVGRRRYIALIAVAITTGVFAGMFARMDASRVLINYAIQGIAAGRTDASRSASPPPAGMVVELTVFHKYQPGGFDYNVAMPELEKYADIIGQGLRSPFVVYEDDRPLGPAHSRSADIHNLGHGRFSHWTAVGFIISSSDGTNPATNGRKYWVVLPDDHGPLLAPATAANAGPTNAKAAEAAEVMALGCRFTDEFNSIEVRKTLWRDAMRLVPSAGPFGFGLAKFMDLSCIKDMEVHNSVLQATVEFGWFAGLFLVLLIGAAGYRLLAISRIDADARFVLCALAQAAITSLAHGSIAGDLLLFAVIGLAAAACETDTTRSRNHLLLAH